MLEITGYTLDDLLDTARELLSRSDAKAKGLWPRAAAHLCRQALEATVQEFWKERLPGLETTSMRAQLACLPVYLNHELAGRATYAWSTMSSACHHHVYELAPSAAQLRAWLAITSELAAEVANSRARDQPEPRPSSGR